MSTSSARTARALETTKQLGKSTAVRSSSLRTLWGLRDDREGTEAARGSRRWLDKDSVAPASVLAQEEGRERSREAPTYFLPGSELMEVVMVTEERRRQRPKRRRLARVSRLLMRLKRGWRHATRVSGQGGTEYCCYL